MVLVIGKYTILIISLVLLYAGLCFSSTNVLAEAIGTPGYDLSQTPPPVPEPVYATVIAGYVVDEDGNGVPGATVTLWENGKVWQFSGKMYYNGGDKNPVSSDIRVPGSFTFGEVATDNYTIVVEKCGFKGSKDFYVSSDTGRKFGEMSLRFSETSVNVTLKGYRVPVFNSTQLSYSGAITGTISDRWYYMPGANVSLWQNGKMLMAPKNPQLSGENGTYLFEHLAPGQYEVRAEARDGWATQNNSTSVLVNNCAATADLKIHGLAPHSLPIAPTPEATNISDNSTAQPMMLNTSVSTPAPFAGLELIVIAIGMAAVLVNGLRRWP